MLYTFIIFLFRSIGWLFYRHKVELDGSLYDIKGGIIIAPNHISYLDPPLVAASWKGDLYFFAGKHLFSKRGLKWILPKLHCYPVEKGKEIATMRMALQLLSEGKKVVVFPEGTRSKSGKIGEMKSGVAFLSLRSKCPIIPCYLEGTYEAWPRSSKRPLFFGKRTKCCFGRPIYPIDGSGVALSKDEVTKLIQEELLRLEKL